MARIIDMAGLAGAYGARLLAEAGHDVMRVESRAGDELRRMGPFADEPNPEHGAYHQYLNAGKRSLTLDFAAGDGQRAFIKLVVDHNESAGYAGSKTNPGADHGETISG